MQTRFQLQPSRMLRAPFQRQASLSLITLRPRLLCQKSFILRHSRSISTNPLKTAIAKAPIPPWAAKLPTQLTWIHPYLSLARLDKPIGTWLLFWPCGSFFAPCAPHTVLMILPISVVHHDGSILFSIADWWTGVEFSIIRDGSARHARSRLYDQRSLGQEDRSESRSVRRTRRVLE